MDIAKYIGQFLLKNNFCYLHGLGNLELKRKPARYDGDALHAPEYDVILTPGGSIDDTLANYIATHEQTSISKAANALREFSTATRAELAAGKEVEIPAIGKFTEQAGLIRFIANPHLQHVPPPVPMLRMSKRLEDAPDFKRETTSDYTPDNSKSIAWGKIILIVLLIAGIATAAFFGIRYFNNSAPVTKTDTAIAAPLVTEPLTPQFTDTATQQTDTARQAAPSVSAAVNSDGYTVILNTYASRQAADKRAATLTANGNKVEVMSHDSGNHFVIMKITCSPVDTMRVLDSLRRFFNPKGVRILH